MNAIRRDCQHANYSRDTTPPLVDARCARGERTVWMIRDTLVAAKNDVLES